MKIVYSKKAIAYLLRLMKKEIKKRNGFTIVELIIAGAMSVTMIGVGFSIVQIALKGNRIDETQMGLSGKLNDALDFILDEVKVGKRIIDNEADVKTLNPNCIYPINSQFLFGIRLPDQALVKGDYNPEGDQFNLNQVECPIVYTLRPSNNDEKMPLSLVRYGPQYNDKGYYISPSYEEFKETVLVDGITSQATYTKIECPEGWNNIKTFNGISFCIDQFKKSIELQIEVESNQSLNRTNPLKSIASTAGFSAIQDETQISLISEEEESISEIPICMGGNCCWMGVCLKSNKITYIIDRSYLMNEQYDLHPNGLIKDGKWSQIDDPRYISPRLNGKSLFSYTIDTLKQKINKLPTSNMVSDNKKVYLQIIALNNTSEYLFANGPRELTIDNKNSALSFLNRLTAKGDSLDPWEDLCSALESENVGQVILLSASIPSKTEGSCIGREGNYAEIVDDYNRVTRSKTAMGSLIIDSISLFHNFCESSKNYANNKWLGLISSGAESACTQIK